MLTGNKGEWSEIYVLFKLLGDKILQPGNGQIEKIQEVVYPILKILRSDHSVSFQYTVDVSHDLVIISGGKDELSIPIQTFKKQATLLLEEIKANSKTFSIPKTEAFMRSIHCSSIKASSSAKTDITIVVHDQRTNQQPTLGFSIKSQLGNPSTLLNAGKTTNFVYKVVNLKLHGDEINAINSIGSRTKIKDRIEEIESKGGQLKFVSTEKPIFSNNLRLIDSMMPCLLAEMVYTFYTSRHAKMTELLNLLKERNPLKFDLSQSHPFYSYKLKRFLTDIALGFMPSKVWTGMYDSTGGYLIVKEDGDILCYHIYNRNVFEDYLLNNTKLDTASSKRHDFGKIYTQNNNLYFKLNLQIRFIK